MNRQRGSMNIQLDGKDYECRLDFNALCELEDTVGCSAVEIVASARDKIPAVKRIAAIVWAGIRGSSRRPEECPTLEQVGKLCIVTGIQAVWPQCLKLVTLSICSDEMYEAATSAEESAGKDQASESESESEGGIG